MATIFVVNIPYSCTESDFKEWVANHGVQATSMRMIRDMRGEASPAFAHIEVAEAELIGAISKLNGATFLGRSILAKKSMVATRT